MTPEYEYIDIDPANPPEMPCDAVFTNTREKEWSADKWMNGELTEIHITRDGLKFKSLGLVWNHAKLRKEKPIDFRNRWVKIKTWAEQESQYGLDEHGFVSVSLFSRLMELGLPANRIVFINGCGVYTDTKACMWNTTREMISEILPIDYQPERELDDTVKRLWWYKEPDGVIKITQAAYTEKYLFDNILKNWNRTEYASFCPVPSESEWRKV